MHYVTRTIALPVTSHGSELWDANGDLIATVATSRGPLTASSIADLMNLGAPIANEREDRYDRDQAEISRMVFAQLKREKEAKLAGLARELVEYQMEQFDGSDDVDLCVSGSDLVDWFSGFRERVKAVL